MSMLSYIVTRFVKSVFTGPVKPTPGTAIAYAQTPSPDAGLGFKGQEYGKENYPDQKWPGTPPIDVEIKNLARPPEMAGIEESIVLVGINPGDLRDSGNTPSFQPQTPMGRSSPFQLYQYSQARQISLTLNLHRDMFAFYKPIGDQATITADWAGKQMSALTGISGDVMNPQTTNGYVRDRKAFIENSLKGEILEAYRNTINWLRALQLPVYSNGGVIAPRVWVRVGKFLQVEGYPSVGVDYSNSYSEGYPVSAKVSLQVTETVQNAYDQKVVYNKEHRSGGMDFVEWPSK